MSDAELAQRRLEKMIGGLAAGDDFQSRKRVAIAKLYLELGLSRDAAKWFLEAAKHAGWSENGVFAVAFAEEALRLGQDAPELVAECNEVLSKFRGSGSALT